MAKVLDLVSVSKCPQEAVRQPPRAASYWYSQPTRKALEAQRSTGGRNVLRRLTAYEYETLRDLLGLDLKFIQTFPRRNSSGGFKNTAVSWAFPPCTWVFREDCRDALGRILLAPKKSPQFIL